MLRSSSVCLLLANAVLIGGELNYRDVRTQVLEQERKEVPDIWVLDFKFRPVRYIKTNVPASGTELVWYMRYQVWNSNSQPLKFFPRFTLVTNEGKVYEDTILPHAEHAVRLREDPAQPLLNSVSISSDPLSPLQPQATPDYRFGVVFFRNVDPTTRSFTIFVTGLSNGYTKVVDPKTGDETIRRKTLKLDFIKRGDTVNMSENEIQLVNEPTWIYR